MNSPTGQTRRWIFTLDVSNDADSRKEVHFGGFVDIASHFGGEIPRKPQFLGREQAFSSQTGKILKISCYRNYCINSTKFCTTIETIKWSSRVVPIGAQQIQHGVRPPF